MAVKHENVQLRKPSMPDDRVCSPKLVRPPEFRIGKWPFERNATYLLMKCPEICDHKVTENLNLFPKMSFGAASRKWEVMIAILAFGGIVLVVSAGLFGAYTLGFYDGVKDGERLAADRTQ